MGDNFDDGFETFCGEKPDRSRPYPATITVDPDDPNNHVFMADVHQIDCIDDCNAAENPGASIAWSNQFWIMSPQTWKPGTKIRLKFKYKAEHACNVGTQIHTQYPSKYKWWQAVDDVAFTTGWQEFDRTIELSEDQAKIGEDGLGGASLAFNLCSDADNGRTPNQFYFDDLSWEVLKLDHGFFVAGKGASVAYDYSQAAQFTEEDEDYYTVTIGKEGVEDSWVEEIMISTVRGDNSAFKGATLKPTKAIVLNAKGKSDWLDYTESSNAKIKLPAAGVYDIELDPDAKQMRFTQVEGDTPKEAVDIVTNETNVVVNGQERHYLNADEAAADGVTDLPEDYAFGAAWDNQFFLIANRTLAAGEITVLKFKYKASVNAKTTTQCHNEPGQYVHWGALGEVNFATEWTDFETTFTIPTQCDGSDNPNGYKNDFKCFAFNMAEIKEACKYEIKDVQWYLKYDEEGKTTENLIDAEGTKNFFVKEGAGTTPYEFGTENPNGISTVTSQKNIGSAVIYNLAGQRVSNSFKGIVVKDGKKYVK